MSKIFRTRPERNCREWDWKEEVRSLGLRKKLNYQSLLLRVVFLWTIPDC